MVLVYPAIVALDSRIVRIDLIQYPRDRHGSGWEAIACSRYKIQPPRVVDHDLGRPMTTAKPRLAVVLPTVEGCRF